MSHKTVEQFKSYLFFMILFCFIFIFWLQDFGLLNYIFYTTPVQPQTISLCTQTLDYK